MKDKKIAVLIPCYNESKTIEKVVKDYKEVLPDADIYVYDNNSTDGTAEIAKQAGAIVRYEYRQGKGNVIRTMFREIDADCYLMIDGDDTYPKENAREMCDLVLSGKADIKDMYMWKSQNESVHQPLIDYLKYNTICDDYLKAEELLKQKVDTKTYLIYKRKFIDGYSYERISEEFDMSNPRIKECLDKCYYFLIGRLNI